MITILVVKLKLANEDTIGYGSCILNEEYLKDNIFITVEPNNNYGRIVCEESSPFLMTDIPKLVPDQDHYMIPQFISQDRIHTNAFHP